MAGNKEIRRFSIDPLTEKSDGPWMLYEAHRDHRKRVYQAGIRSGQKQGRTESAAVIRETGTKLLYTRFKDKRGAKKGGVYEALFDMTKAAYEMGMADQKRKSKNGAANFLGNAP